MNLLDYPAKLTEIPFIDEIRKKHYPPEVLVPRKLYELLILRQRESVSILEVKNEAIGYYAIIFLDESVYKNIIAHKIEERDLANPEYIPVIHAPKDYNGKYIYILSVVAKDLKKHNLNLLILYSLRKKLISISGSFTILGIFANFFNPKIKNIFQSLNIQSV
jgi:hypothetical protein